MATTPLHLRSPRILVAPALIVIACAAPALFARAAFAQGDSGSVIGYVVDASGLPLRGVKVTTTSPTQIGGAKTAYTNDEGFFRFAPLSPGTFEVRASAPRLKTVIQREIHVGISAPAEVTIIMDVEAQQETVQVIEKPPAVSTTKANITQTFDLDFVEGLPHENRDNVHQQMINSVPGAMNGRVRGGASNQTRFTQDGFEMRGQYPTLKSSAAYEVQSGGYGADAPTASGGAVNLVTRSGSNKWELGFNATADSSRLRFFKDSRDTGTNYQYIVNPTISGPIIRDLLWFHLNFESHLEERVRDRAVDAEYLPPPPRFEKYIQKGTLNLTWQVSARNKLQSLSNFDFPSERNRRDDPGVERVAQEHRDGQRWFTGLIWESLLTDTLLLRTQAGYTYIPNHIYPAMCTYEPECDHIPFSQQKQPRNIWSGNNGVHERNDVTGWQVFNRLEWFAGQHNLTLKNSFFTEQDVRRISRPGDLFLEYQGTMPEARTVYWSNDPRVDGEGRKGWFITGVTVTRDVATLSDQWRLTRRLTVTPALSYIWATATNTLGHAAVQNRSWAPSLTGAWDATQDGRTVIRGGLSTYVDVEIGDLARHTLGGQTSERCLWDAATSTYSRSCTYSGGSSRNTFGRPCGPSGKNVDGTDCSEPLQIPRTWEYTFGGAREVVQGIALSLDGVYRNFRSQYELRETNRIWLPGGDALDANGGFKNGRNETVVDLGTPDGARRTYLGVTAGLDKREGRLKINTSYTWSRLAGNVFNGSDNWFGDIPGRDVYTYGHLPDDHRHEVKAQLGYQVARWGALGVRYGYFSGLPFSRRFRNDVTGSFESLRAGVGLDPGSNINDPGDDRQLRRPDQHSVNFQLRINWLPLIGHHLDTYVDVLNVLALRTTTSVGENDGQNWGVETGRMSPFRIRLGVNYRY